MFKKLQTAGIFLISIGLFFQSFGIALAQSGAFLSVDPESVKIGVSQVFSTDIIVDSGSNQVGGVGVILHYDKDYLSVDHIETGDTFSDYPLAASDDSQGKVAISGVVGSPSQLVSGAFAVGKIFWRALKIGTTQVNFDYQPGSTTDSNVAVTNGSGDALSGVSNLSVEIVNDPQPNGISEEAQATATPTSTPSPTPQTFIGRVGSIFNSLIGRSEPTPDPTAPIIGQAPKTSFNELPEEQSIQGESPLLAVVIVVLVSLVVVMIIVFLIKLVKRGKGGGKGGSGKVMNPQEIEHVAASAPAPLQPQAPTPPPPAPVSPTVPKQTTPAIQPKQESSPVIERR